MEIGGKMSGLERQTVCVCVCVSRWFCAWEETSYSEGKGVPFYATPTPVKYMGRFYSIDLRNNIAYFLV